MAKMIGILADVSIKRQTQIRDGKLVDQQWGRFVFKCIENLIIPETTTKDDLVFAIGYGTSAHDSGTFDLLSTIKKETEETKKVSTQQSRNVDKRGLIEGSLSILEKNGAKFVRKWLPVDVMMEVVSQPDTVLLFSRLQSDKTFLKAFVADCLPRICRDSKIFARLIGSASVMAIGAGLYVVSPAGLVIGAVAACASGIMYFFDIPYTPARPGIKLCKVVANAAKKVFVGLAGCRATKNDIRELVAKAKSYMFLVDSSVEVTPYSVQSVSDILQLRVHGDESAAYERARRLDKVVEPVISEERPFFKALAQASKRFFEQRNTNRRKLLFVISGGPPTDLSSALQDRIEKMKRNGVTVVGCYVKDPVQNQKRLYTIPQDDWKDDVKLMFHYCSNVNLDKLPPTISRQKGWVIDSINNETKMFLLFNGSGLKYPNSLDDVCSLARSAMISDTDALLLHLSPVNSRQKNTITQYIDLCRNKKFGPGKQEGGTCYANAVAAGIDLSVRRILGRDGGYPNFKDVLKYIIDKYGKEGADILEVLKDVCPMYRLRSQSVDAQGALSAIAKARPVIARFRLTSDEWSIFSNFYRNNPKGILTKSDLNIANRQKGKATEGHAVVFTSFNGEYFRFMNSWGTNWADDGFFRVQNADVLGFEFFDVFWYESDLSLQEKQRWKECEEDLRADLTVKPGYDEDMQKELPEMVIKEYLKTVGSGCCGLLG